MTTDSIPANIREMREEVYTNHFKRGAYLGFLAFTTMLYNVAFIILLVMLGIMYV